MLTLCGLLAVVVLGVLAKKEKKDLGVLASKAKH